MDSYVSNELMVETAQEVARRLQRCRACANELEARERVRQLLQSAVRRDAASLSLRANIGQSIRKKPFATWTSWTLAIAAALALIAAGLGIVRILRSQDSGVHMAQEQPRAEQIANLSVRNSL